MKFILFTLLFVPLVVYSQLDERVAPKDFSKENQVKDIFLEQDESNPEYDTTPIISKTKGLILTKPGMKFLPGEISQVDGVEIIDLHAPGKPEILVKELKALFYDKPLTMKKIAELKKAIIQFYRKANHPVVTVVVPEQDVTDGVLILYVMEARVGKVKIEGNEWFNSSKLREYVRLQEEQDIDSSYLNEDLHWLNRNPFRESSVVLKPGELEGTTDVEFWTRDRLPLRFYGGIENTGFDRTGRGRLFGGVQWGNAFGADQILSYQYTTSTDFGKFFAHTAHWTIPIQRFRHILEFFGGYSKVHPNMPTDMSSDGRNVQVSGRYTIPLAPSKIYLHEVKFGADYKKTNNNIFFSLEPIFANTALITQVMAGYNGSYGKDFNKTSFDVEVYLSPGDIFPHQSDRTYQQLRPFAKSSYVYFRGHLFIILRLPKSFSFSVNSQFQAANQNLLPTEQFGIGGYSTVRGYDERAVNVDNAFLLSAEVRTPPFSILKLIRPSTKTEDVFQSLFFLDYGIGSNHKQVPGEFKSQYLLGIGPGIRYNIDVNLSFRADLGFKLHKVPSDGSGKKFHFSLLLSY